MGLTLTERRERFFENKRVVEADVAFDSSYPTNGETVDLAAVGLTRVVAIEQLFDDDRGAPTVADTTNTGVSVRPVLTDVYAPKLKLYTGAATEATNTSDQSLVVVRLRFIGA
jgi:hypothetical protein